MHTLALPVVDKLAAVFRGVDLEAQLSLLAVNLAAKVPSHPLTHPCVPLCNTLRVSQRWPEWHVSVFNSLT